MLPLLHLSQSGKHFILLKHPVDEAFPTGLFGADSRLGKNDTWLSYAPPPPSATKTGNAQRERLPATLRVTDFYTFNTFKSVALCQSSTVPSTYSIGY